MDNQTDRDLLSDLPLNIIHSILTLVPIRDAVRTCILSKQWRHNWTTLPHLDFNNKCVDQSVSVDGRKECLKTMVNNVLSLHKGPIQKFELQFKGLYSCPNTDLWLLWLSTKEIQELCLQIYLDEDTLFNWFRVHSSLYSCRKLTHLDLYRCELPPPPPTFKGFSCLRSLVLTDVDVPSDIVESLVANSPLLEDFAYDKWKDPDSSELRISAPILKCFHLSGAFKEISLYAPLVDKVTVHLFNDDFTAKQQSSVCNYIKFLVGFTNLKWLTGSKYFTKYLSIGIESYDHSLVFHHLKFIRLDDVSFEDKKHIAVVGHLIMGAPNLQTLEISINRYSPTESKAPPISHSDFSWAPNLTFNKLRAIRMDVMMGSDDLGRFPYELEFIKILLRSSTTLETMTLCFFGQICPDGNHGMSNLITKVLSYCWASPNTKILFKLPMGKIEFNEM